MRERMSRCVVLLILAVTGCAHAPPPPATDPGAGSLPVEVSRAFDRGLSVAEDYLVSEIAERRFTHEQLWSVLGPLIDPDDFTVEETTFNGRIRWIQIDVGADAEDADHYITPEQRLRIAMAIQ